MWEVCATPQPCPPSATPPHLASSAPCESRAHAAQEAFNDALDVENSQHQCVCEWKAWLKGADKGPAQLFSSSSCAMQGNIKHEGQLCRVEAL